MEYMMEWYNMYWEYQNKGNDNRFQNDQLFVTKKEAWQECFNIAQSMSENNYDYWKAWVEHPDGSIGINITPG